MKVKFEVEIHDYEVVNVPVYYETNIMKVGNKLVVYHKLVIVVWR